MITKEVRNPNTNELVAIYNFPNEPEASVWNKILKTYFPDNTIDRQIATIKNLKTIKASEALSIVSSVLLSSTEDAQAIQLAEDDMGRLFSNKLTAALKACNKLNAINAVQATWVHHRLRAVTVSSLIVPGVGTIPLPEPWTIDMMNLIISGDLELSYIIFNSMQPDDMSQSYHWLSSGIINVIKASISKYLGWS